MPKEKAQPTRKTYGLRLDQALMKELHYLGVDEDRWINDLVEEAIAISSRSVGTSANMCDGQQGGACMTAKEELHRLVEELSDSEIHAARRFLEFLRTLEYDPLLHALSTAPVDDEPTTPEEEASAAEAWREYQQGQARPWADVRKELAGE
jgi:hypothetical protein